MFQGFSEETIDFLWGIRFNNHREWFLAHKQAYLDTLYRPLCALGEDLLEEMQRLRPKDNLQLKVTRIYRDARRVKYGGLYKDHLWLCIRTPHEEWSPHPEFYFGIDPEGYRYGMGYSSPHPEFKEQKRRRVLREPKALETLARRLNRQERFVLGGDEYKRAKGTVSPLLTPWFTRKDIALTASSAPDARMTTPELKDAVLDGFRWLMPYYRYFKALELEPPVTERF